MYLGIVKINASKPSPLCGDKIYIKKETLDGKKS